MEALRSTTMRPFLSNIQLTQPVAPMLPANCGFSTAWSDYFRDRFAGQPLKPLALTHGNITHQGEAMITATGIEGGVVYALSSAIRDAIVANGKTVVSGSGDVTVTVTGSYSTSVSAGSDTELSSDTIDRSEFDSRFGTSTAWTMA